ncbi:MAG: SDR family NAD(P)-dependent oxidoreductase [Oscillospiraceae bacterium]|jgi:NAD(P)-dependent dehydrogenase (short-subunit alcohol dehydrogenase family)|nr:SDR family NAD(P)-dependent oxidoreductase [Oscillospiraceae bacterium]
MKTLQGKTAFITGAASGIGLGIAKACAKHGANIVIADIRRPAIDEALTWFKDRGFPAHGIVLDVTSREQYAAAADEAESVFGNIHILVNNAGVEVPSGKIYNAAFKDADFIFSVNIGGILNGIITVVPRIVSHGEEGHVIATSSMAGMSVVPGAGLYNTTKQATIGMMESLASDLVGTNVGASAFCPGPVQSNLSQTSLVVRPDALKTEAAPPPPPPPPIPTDDTHTAGFVAHQMPDFSRAFIPAEEAGERVVRGILRGDLYIVTHPEFRNGVKARGDAMVRSFPDEVPSDPVRKEVFDGFFTFLTHNPVYDTQTTPGAPDWTVDWEVAK